MYFMSRYLCSLTHCVSLALNVYSICYHSPFFMEDSVDTEPHMLLVRGTVCTLEATQPVPCLNTEIVLISKCDWSKYNRPKQYL